ncbi:MAG: hypothetical protein EA413_01205 [Cyanobium sp. PLM2.Bin73]|nr:MAG: hypothetical protein EA413_01205 [Cyanobium sp. PLM2.Bin73]
MPQISLRQYDYTPQLGWSSTRWETFRTCRRRYFFQYYGRYDREIPLAHIQRLKGLSSIAMTVGTAVHEVLARLLKRLLQSSAAIDAQRFWPYVEGVIGEELATTTLMEVHYGQRPAPEPAAAGLRRLGAGQPAGERRADPLRAGLPADAVYGDREAAQRR